MSLAILSHMKKRNFISVLEENGFKVLTSKKEINAYKGEHHIVVNDLGEVSLKVDFTKVFSKINYQKNISGIPQLELKKLIKEEKKTNQYLFDTFLHIINKLNWAQRFYEEIPLEEQNVKIVEFYDEGDEIYSFIFLQQEDNEYMFMTRKSHKEIYDLINKSLSIELEDLIPDIENIL